MGVNNVLPKLLESSGRPIDLRDFQAGVSSSLSASSSSNNNGKLQAQRRRPLRIGIDIISWIYTAGFAFSDVLGDARHLTNYGRADLVQEQQVEGSQAGPSEANIQSYVVQCTQYVLKRLQTFQDTTNAQLLVVLDGRSPPIKGQEVRRRRQISKEHNQLRQDPTVALGSPETVQVANDKRTMANKRAGPGPYLARILDSVAEALQKLALSESRFIALLVAPYEADGQLAYLANQRYIDLIVTEDSDLIAHGPPCILYKSLPSISKGVPAGILWQKSDVGALPLGSRSLMEETGILPQIKASLSGSPIDLMDFTPTMMATLFVLLGCDYTVGANEKKLKGIGLVTGHRIVRKAFLGGDSIHNGKEQGRRNTSVLRKLWEDAYQHMHSPNILTPEYKDEYERSFMEALFMYRHPVVFDPLLQRCVHINEVVGPGGNTVIGGDAELMEYPPYASLCGDYERIGQITGELPPSAEAVGIAEGRIKWRSRVMSSSTGLQSLRKRRRVDQLEKGKSREGTNDLFGTIVNRGSWEMDDDKLEQEIANVDFDDSDDEQEGQTKTNSRTEHESDKTGQGGVQAGLDGLGSPVIKLARKLFPIPHSSEKPSEAVVDSQETILFDTSAATIATVAPEGLAESQVQLLTQQDPRAQEDRENADARPNPTTTSLQKLRRRKRDRNNSPTEHTSLLGSDVNTETPPKESPKETGEDSDATVPMSLEKTDSNES